MRWALIGLGLLLISIPAGGACGQPLNLILPTTNRALLKGNGPAFYMYTNRTFDGRHWQPWQGGTYGFSRNPQHTDAGLIYTRMHEGMDIQPLRRNAQGEPLDRVRAIDAGRVAYVNNQPGRSAFGIYVVIEHQWGGSPFYSLYAHMSEAYVRTGERVAQGERIGRIGYTGAGLDRERAHLHFEIGILLNRNFQKWYDTYYSYASNRHGMFNGFNLRGLDVAALYKALEEHPSLTIRSFLARQPASFRIVAERDGPLDLLERYPWLARHADRLESEAWAITFTRTGVPLSVVPVAPPTAELPVVTMSPSRGGPCGLLTSDILTGPSGDCRVGEDGRRYLDLLILAGPPDRERVAW